MTHVILMSLVFRHNCHVPVPTVSQLRQVWSNYHLRTFERKILDEYMFMYPPEILSTPKLGGLCSLPFFNFKHQTSFILKVLKLLQCAEVFR